MPLFKIISLGILFFLFSKAMRRCAECWVMLELPSHEIKLCFQVKKDILVLELY